MWSVLIVFEGDILGLNVLLFRKLCGYVLNHRIVQVPLKIYIIVFSGLGATNVFLLKDI